ncbi:Stonustoxin subunit alpha [Pelomyxa schiedti]|nr:Stonustoxin subunit alpha [Pelomyxa schiedti]
MSHAGTTSAVRGMNDSVLNLEVMGRRGIDIGCCYDARNEQFLRLSLWNPKSLEVLTSKPVYEGNQKMKVTIERDLSDRLSDLDVSAELKLSILAGLIDVSGSGAFVKTKLVNKNVVRVVFTINVVTHWIGLTMDQLGKGKKGKMLFDQQHISEREDVTHVVSQIIYGVNGHFAFDLTLEESQDRTAIEGKLGAMVKKVPGCRIGGEGSVTYSDEENQLSSRISVYYDGDLILDTPPTTFLDAVRAVKQFTSKEIRNNAVPLKVQLTPLSMLLPHATRICRKISLDTLQGLLKLQCAIEGVAVDLRALKTDCVIPEVKDVISTLEDAAGDLKMFMQAQLLEKIPLVRKDGTGREEAALLKLYTSLIQGAFRPSYFKAYAEKLLHQVRVLNQIIKKANTLKSAVKGTSDLKLMSLSSANSQVEDDIIVVQLKLCFETDYIKHLAKRLYTADSSNTPAPLPLPWDEDAQLLTKLAGVCQLALRKSKMSSLKPIFCLESTKDCGQTPSVLIRTRKNLLWHTVQWPPGPKYVLSRDVPNAKGELQVSWGSPLPGLSFTLQRKDPASESWQECYQGPGVSHKLSAPPTTLFRLCTRLCGESSAWVMCLYWPDMLPKFPMQRPQPPQSPAASLPSQQNRKSPNSRAKPGTWQC